MKWLLKKKFVHEICLQPFVDPDIKDAVLHFDSAFQGNVIIKCRKHGRSMIIDIEVDGYEFGD